MLQIPMDQEDCLHIFVDLFGAVDPDPDQGGKNDPHKYR